MAYTRLNRARSKQTTERYGRYENGIIQGDHRAIPTVIADEAGYDGLGFQAHAGTMDDSFHVLNMFDDKDRYVDSIAVGGAIDDDHAIAVASTQLDHLGGATLKLVQGQAMQADSLSLGHSEALATSNTWSIDAISKLMDNPSQNRGFNPVITASELDEEASRVTFNEVEWEATTWNGDDWQGGTRILSHGGRDSVMYLDMTRADTLNQLVTPFELEDELMAMGTIEQASYDALIENKGRLHVLQDRLFNAMARADIGDLKVVGRTQTKEFKRQGVANIAFVFDLSDGQKISIWFHSPDNTPAKLLPQDVMISWKWTLNKRDVTAILSPKNGDNVVLGTLASRMMRLAAKNSKRFASTQARAAKAEQELAEAQADYDSKQATIAQLDTDIADLTAKIDAAMAAPKAPVPANDISDDISTVNDGSASENGGYTADIDNYNIQLKDGTSLAFDDIAKSSELLAKYGDKLLPMIINRVNNVKELMIEKMGWEDLADMYEEMGEDADGLELDGVELSVLFKENPAPTGSASYNSAQNISPRWTIGSFEYHDTLTLTDEQLANLLHKQARAAKTAEPASDSATPASAPVTTDAPAIPIEPAASLNVVQNLDALMKLAPKKGEAVTSDDPDAIEKLEAKLAYLQAYAAMMRDANKHLRNGNDAALTAMGFKDSTIAKLKEVDYAGRAGFVDYQMSNNNGEISRTKKRLKKLYSERSETAAAPEKAVTNISEKNNTETGSEPEPVKMTLEELKVQENAQKEKNVTELAKQKGWNIIDVHTAQKTFKVPKYVTSNEGYNLLHGVSVIEKPVIVLANRTGLKAFASAWIDTGYGVYAELDGHDLEAVSPLMDYMSSYFKKMNPNATLEDNLFSDIEENPAVTDLGGSDTPTPTPISRENVAVGEAVVWRGATDLHGTFRGFTDDGAQAVIIVNGSQMSAPASEVYLDDTPPNDDPNNPKGTGKSSASKRVIEGKTNTAKTPKGTKIVSKFAVVDAKFLIASHTASGSKNPKYPQELQPRDRGREQSIAWVQKTAKTLDPESLGRTSRVDTGAPIVGDDLVVESGNGRTIAIKMAYRDGDAGEYREWLIENADMFGLTSNQIEGFKEPILVRIRQTELNRVDFTVEANQDDKLSFTASERAKSDAKRITDGMLELFSPSESGDLLSASNYNFVKNFLASLGDAEAAQYTDSNGQPTQALAARMKAAVFSKAYDDDRLLEMMADQTNPDTQNMINALSLAAGKFVEAQASNRAQTQDITDGIVNAVEQSLNNKVKAAIVDASNILSNAKRNNQDVAEYVTQLGLFEDVDPATAELAVFLANNSRSAKKMAEYFKAMAGFVDNNAKHSQTFDIFGDPEPVSLSDVINHANQVTGGSDLFSEKNMNEPAATNIQDDALAERVAKIEAIIKSPDFDPSTLDGGDLIELTKSVQNNADLAARMTAALKAVQDKTLALAMASIASMTGGA